MAPLPGLPPGAIELVRPHLQKTTGYVLAGRGDCVEIQKRELATIKNRIFKTIKPADLASTRFPKHWILAAVMRPGDDTTELTGFAKALDPADRDRIRFYWHKGTRPAVALRAWLDAGLGPIQDDDIDGWGRFHQLFGAHHSIQAYRDHVIRP